MKIGLVDVDGHAKKKKWGATVYPNLALCKISAWHKAQGDEVVWYEPMFTGHCDKVYISKVFNFTPDVDFFIDADEIIKGGTGYDATSSLPYEIDMMQPDYGLYPLLPKDTAYGFLTRGCPNKCKWCVVPKKEGKIAPYMDIEEIAVEGRNKIILMDNNVLASDFGLQQIEKIVRLGLKVDFNQALDARLVTPEIGDLLARVKWIKRIRFGCDTQKQIEECERAISYIDKAGYKGEYFFYCILMNDFGESFSRVQHWKERGGRFIVHCQPYRDPINPQKGIPEWQRYLSQWADKKQTFLACEFKDFEPRKGFKCEKYFNK
jgi:hypothetical protein